MIRARQISQFNLTEKTDQGDVSTSSVAQRTPWVNNGGPIMADILVVDDDDVIRDTLCELLAVDHNCEQAKTAEEALRKLEAQSFDVVLTDITMPGRSGSELRTRVLER
jgi:PleD family two-component response regulator